jgi:hypothetical protein
VRGHNTVILLSAWASNGTAVVGRIMSTSTPRRRMISVEVFDQPLMWDRAVERFCVR